MRGTQCFILVVLIVGVYFLGANSFNPFARHDAAQEWKGTLQAAAGFFHAAPYHTTAPAAPIASSTTAAPKATPAGRVLA